MARGRGTDRPDGRRTVGSAWLRTALERCVGIDARALAAFRVAVGAILLADLAYRTRSLTAFYTDAGVLPREANAAVYPTLSQFSIHSLSGSASVQWLLFAIAALFAILLVVGYRTRFAAVGSWLLLASLQFRNYLVLNGGDTVLLVALFVALFLPLGRRWSLDALAGRPDASPRGATQDTKPRDGTTDVWSRDGTTGRTRIVGFGSAALLTQILFVYATNAVYKLRSDAWTAGTAMPTIYRVDRFTVLLGDHLAESITLLEALNYGWVALLTLSPLLVLTTSWRRTALVGAFATAHVGMFLTLDLGFFPHAMLACLLLFLPSPVWTRIEATLQPVATRLSARLRDPTDRLPRGPTLPATLQAGVARVVPIATATILVVGALWQGVALGYASAPSEAPVDPAEHNWKLFAPHPPASDGWFVVTGTLADDTTVDLYPHADTLDGPPPDTAATYPSTRWRKYLAEVRGDATVRRYFAAYLCRWGEDRYGTEVDSLRIEYVRHSVRPGDTAEPTRADLGGYRCPVVE